MPTRNTPDFLHVHAVSRKVFGFCPRPRPWTRSVPLQMIRLPPHQRSARSGRCRCPPTRPTRRSRSRPSSSPRVFGPARRTKTRPRRRARPTPGRRGWAGRRVAPARPTIVHAKTDCFRTLGPWGGGEASPAQPSPDTSRTDATTLLTGFVVLPGSGAGASASGTTAPRGLGSFQHTRNARGNSGPKRRWPESTRRARADAPGNFRSARGDRARKRSSAGRSGGAARRQAPTAPARAQKRFRRRPWRAAPGTAAPRRGTAPFPGWNWGEAATLLRAPPLSTGKEPQRNRPALPRFGVSSRPAARAALPIPSRASRE